MHWSMVHQEPVSRILKLALLAEHHSHLHLRRGVTCCSPHQWLFFNVWPTAVHTSGFFMYDLLQSTPVLVLFVCDLLQYTPLALFVWPVAVHSNGSLYEYYDSSPQQWLCMWPTTVHSGGLLHVTCCCCSGSVCDLLQSTVVHVTCCSPQWWLSACDLPQWLCMWPAAVHISNNNVLFYMLFL